MSNSDERAAQSLIERVLMEAEDGQLQDLVVEAIDVLIALHEARGWPRNELENRGLGGTLRAASGQMGRRRQVSGAG